MSRILNSIQQVHTMNLDPKWFELIIKGDKRYEVRMFDRKRQKIMLNDIIKFINNKTGEEIRKTVIDIDTFDNFEQLFDFYEFGSIVPGVKDIDEAISIYHSIPGYLDALREFKVVVFELDES